MSFLDELKSRLPFGQQVEPEPYGDEPYDDYYDEGADGAYDSYTDDYAQPAQGGYRGYEPADAGNGMLGQTRRGEAESVAVYTRSGQLVSEGERHATTYTPAARDAGYRPGAYDTPSSYAQGQFQRAAAPEAPAVTEAHAGSLLDANPQLPAYILRPESYDDVETVVRRVRTRQPVALVFAGVRTEVAKRVLDFSYGFACGLGATVREVGDRLFMVLPAGCEVKDSDLAKLRAEGYLKR